MEENLDLTGKAFGGYQVIRKLGRGGMAVVYKAHEMSLNRVVALKVPTRLLIRDPSFRKRFQREAQASAQLNHPNIVQIYAIGEEDGIPFFAMEFVKGKTLQEILRETGPMNVSTAVPLARQVAQALAAAHDGGVVHRDIKPANILVDTTGRVKVTDFGIAQVAAAGTKLTAEGSFMGTPEYISPEQCEGLQVDGRSDIYSLGVTLYEMLTGKAPFEADTPAGLVLKIVQGRFPPIGQVNPGIPAQVQGIVQKMMAKERALRYQKASELVTSLKQIESGAASVSTVLVEGAAAAAPARPVQTAGAEKKRQRIGAVAGVALAVIAILGAASYILYGHMAGRQEPSQPAARHASPAPKTLDGTAQPRSEETIPTPDRQRAREAAGREADPARSAARSAPSDRASAPAAQGTSSATLAEVEPPAPALVADLAGPPQGEGAGRTSRQTRTTREHPPAREAPPRPASNTLVLTTTGDLGSADAIHAYVEAAFAGSGFKVIDPMFVRGNLQDAARYQGMTTVSLAGVKELRYYGRASEQYTVNLTMKVVSLEDGTLAAGPVTRTVKYTEANAEETLKEAAEGLASQLARLLGRKAP